MFEQVTDSVAKPNFCILLRLCPRHTV